MLFQKSCRLFAAFGFGSRTLSPVPQRVVNVGLPPPHSHAIAMSRPSLPSSATAPTTSTTESSQHARKATFRRSSWKTAAPLPVHGFRIAGKSERREPRTPRIRGQLG